MSQSDKPTIAVENDEIDIITAIRKLAPKFNISPRRAETYGIWTVCYRRYCQSRDIPWLWMDSVQEFMSFLDERADVSATERDRALDGIMFYLSDVRRVQEDDAAAERRNRRPKSTRSLFAQLLLRCDIQLTQAVRLRFEDVDVRSSEVKVRPADEEDEADESAEETRTITLPPSVRSGLKDHLRRLRERTDETNPLLFGHRGVADDSRRRDADDVERTTKLATQVMKAFDE
jgi:hypothetical protein